VIIVLQKVKEASVSVQAEVVGKIKQGVCLFVGIEKGDTEEDARYLACKVAELRIFPDSQRENEPLFECCRGRSLSRFPVYAGGFGQEREEAQF